MLLIITSGSVPLSDRHLISLTAEKRPIVTGIRAVSWWKAPAVVQSGSKFRSSPVPEVVHKQNFGLGPVLNSG